MIRSSNTLLSNEKIKPNYLNIQCKTIYKMQMYGPLKTPRNDQSINGTTGYHWLNEFIGYESFCVFCSV